jgi:hypothetical protein
MSQNCSHEKGNDWFLNASVSTSMGRMQTCGLPLDIACFDIYTYIPFVIDIELSPHIHMCFNASGRMSATSKCPNFGGNISILPIFKNNDILSQLLFLCRPRLIALDRYQLGLILHSHSSPGEEPCEHARAGPDKKGSGDLKNLIIGLLNHHSV